MQNTLKPVWIQLSTRQYWSKMFLVFVFTYTEVVTEINVPGPTICGIIRWELFTHRTPQLSLTQVESFSHNSAVSYATITQWCIFQGGE